MPYFIFFEFITFLILNYISSLSFLVPFLLIKNKISKYTGPRGTEVKDTTTSRVMVTAL